MVMEDKMRYRSLRPLHSPVQSVVLVRECYGRNSTVRQKLARDNLSECRYEFSQIVVIKMKHFTVDAKPPFSTLDTDLTGNIFKVSQSMRQKIKVVLALMEC